MGNQTSEISSPGDAQPQKAPARASSSAALAQKFGKTTNWHLKVVIKGDRGTGKSSLFNRLQGKPFSAKYEATEALQSAKVSWNYRTSHDVVNLDVWDVVDAHKPRKTGSSGLKLVSDVKPADAGYEGTGYDEVDLDMVPVAGRANSAHGSSAMDHLDTSMVDVLRGTHAVVLMFNPMKKWTWDYVKRELEKIPSRIQVLIIANFKDILESPDELVLSSETVEAQEVRDYIDLLPADRPTYFLEASMQNCFGLKGLKTFLNLPFLLLQREVFETQLRQNTLELQNAQDEYRLTTENDSYDNFIKGLSAQASAKAAAAKTAPTPTPQPSQSSTNVTSPTNKAKDVKPLSTSTTVPSSAASPKPTSQTAEAKPKNTTPTNTAPKATPTAKSNETPKSEANEEEGGFFSKIFGGKKKDKELVASDGGKAVAELKKLQEIGKGASASGTVDDFVVEADSSWLQDDEDVPVAKLVAKASAAAKKQTQSLQADSDDDDAPNPALANYDEDLDASDQLMMETLAKIKAEKAAAEKSKPKVAAPPAKITSPSKVMDDDDDEDDDNPMLASYEDDLDFEDQKIVGKPRPQPVAKPSTPAKTDDGSDSDDSTGNPSLAGYSEDIDMDDMLGSVGTSPKPASTTSLKPQGMSGQNSGVSTPTPVLPATATAPKVLSPSVKPTAKPTAKITSSQDSDSESDNDLVARDTGGDSDEDYAGFVPKRAAAVSPVVAKNTADFGDLPDFNPLDADDEDDANAFWAKARQPPPRKPVTTQASASNQSNSNVGAPTSQQTANAQNDPFAFGISSASSTPTSHSKERKDKDKHHKHKDKTHKHKDKKDKRTHSESSPHASHHAPQPQGAHYAPPPSQSEWDFAAQPAASTRTPPIANTQPPAAAPKKSVFYL